MLLYHGTSLKRAKLILQDNAIKTDVERHYTKAKSGSGYSTPGYIYLANEIIFSVYFANCCNVEDKTDFLVIFQMDIPIDKISPDYDEIRIQTIPDHIKTNYSDELELSLKELKSCRVDFDIDFRTYNVRYCIIDLKRESNLNNVICNVGCDYNYVKNNYNIHQLKFIEELKWSSV